MLVNDNNAKKLYERLKEYEGYIQLSGEGILIVERNEELKSWEDLHKNNNFIVEAHFFNSSSNDSVAIRQINNEYKVLEKTLTNEELDTANIFQAQKEKNVKIAQRWEEVVHTRYDQRWEEIEDKYCEGLKVLKPTIQLFAGFVEDNKGETK